MKFYKNKINWDYLNKIKKQKISSIYSTEDAIVFFKDGKYHNSKNAAYINNIYKAFYFNDNCYGDQNDFTKKSWRRFVKMQAFL